jgi:Mrp family chromosome partitioning ATPase
MTGENMKKYSEINRASWRTRVVQSIRFTFRWGWFILLAIILTTVATKFIPDSPSLSVYQATFQVEVQLPAGTGFISENQSTALYTKLFTDPDTLNYALPSIAKQQDFKGIDLSTLQSFISASPVTGTRYFQLSAIATKVSDAKTLVTLVYQAFMDKYHSDRSGVVNGLERALVAQRVQVQSDISSTNYQLQTLKAEGRDNTSQYQYYLAFYRRQQQIQNSINTELAALSQQGTGSNDILQLVNSTPTITSIPGKAPTMSQRLALSPLVGLIMGLGGALLASQFSNKLPLRGKKREMILPHVSAIMPVLPDLNNSRKRIQVLKDTSLESYPLLRRLRYQAEEYEQRLRVIAVTSPRGHEGKSTVATSLAIAAAQSGLRTLLVDANPERPILHSWFQLPNTNGILDAIRSLATGVAGSSPIVSTNIPKLGFIPIGRSIQRKPSAAQKELLRINGLQPFTELLSNQTDLIIFDGSSLLNDTTSINLVSLSDVAVLVMDAQKSKSSRVLAAEDLLSKMGIPYVTVLNRTLR